MEKQDTPWWINNARLNWLNRLCSILGQKLFQAKCSIIANFFKKPIYHFLFKQTLCMEKDSPSLKDCIPRQKLVSVCPFRRPTTNNVLFNVFAILLLSIPFGSIFCTPSNFLPFFRVFQGFLSKVAISKLIDLITPPPVSHITQFAANTASTVSTISKSESVSDFTFSLK